MVMAASSLTAPFKELGRQFEAQHPGVQVEFNFAGSQQLAQQLAILDDGLARQALEGVLQRHHPVVVRARIQAQGEGVGALAAEADGQGAGV